MKFRAVALAVLLGGTAAIAQPVPTTPPLPGAGQWRATTHATGTGYETGTFDQPFDGGIRISCTSDGGATLAVQIRGKAPTAGTRFLLIPATRAARSRTFGFTAGPDGSVSFARARADRQFARLWAALRGGNNVTIRNPEGGFSVQSLDGARTTLPAQVCG